MDTRHVHTLHTSWLQDPTPAFFIFIVYFLGTFAKFEKVTVSFVMSTQLSVHLSAWNNWAPTGRILMELDIWAFFKNL
jgi:hypothetical protein